MKNTPFRVLFREFLFRTVDLELISPNADMSKLFGQIAALLIFLSLNFMVAGLSVGSIKNMPAQITLMLTWSGEHFLIATTMLVTGLLAVLSWGSTFPNRRDVFVLAPLPVRMRTLFLAKVSAVAVALLLTVLALHSLAGFAWPLALFSQAEKTPTPALIYEAPLPPVDVGRLKPVLDRDVAKAQMPGSGALAPGTGAGVAIGVVEHGKRRVFTYGTANADSIFEIGSISKTFTGLLLAKLVVSGKAGLDEPVRALLPDGVVKQRPAREVSLLHLATHRSGLPRMPDNFHPADMSNPYADYHASDLYAWVAKHGLDRPAKPQFEYSNLGFGLLGEALANRAGVPYAELLRREITEPLGMTDTAITLSEDQRRRFMTGYNGRQHATSGWDLDAFAGAGGIRSTAGDMLAYLDAQLHPEKPGSLGRAIHESHLIQAEVGSHQRIALAWIWNGDTRVYWHNGGTGGFSSYAFFDPKRDYAAIVLFNQTPVVNGFADLLGDHIRARLAGEPPVSLGALIVPEHSGFGGIARLFAAYWVTMLGAGAFIYCTMLALQGLAAQLLSWKRFLRVSSYLQIGVFCALAGGYMFLPSAVTPSTILEAQTHGVSYWSPTYWFLGLLQQLTGSPAMAPLAERAWIALALVLALTAASYALSYMRTVRRIVEEPDITPGASRFGVLPGFGAPLTTAVAHFSIRTLMRSQRHRLILAFYWGVALAFVMLGAKTPLVEEHAKTSQQVASIVLLCAAIVGVRVVAAMPFELPANWIFKITPIPAGARTVTAVRISMYAMGLAPAWCVSAALFFWLWPWRAAAGHSVVLALIGVALTETCLAGFHKLPFTCSYLPGKSRLNMAALIFVGLILLIVKGAELERAALNNFNGFLVMVAILGTVAFAAWWRASAAAGTLRFEELPMPAIEGLSLHRDGMPPLISAQAARRGT